MLFPPSQAVRWLGYWLTPTIQIQSSLHFWRRLALAQASFPTISQLSAAGKGLSSWCKRKLVFGTILSILTYGWDLFITDTATPKKLDSFWHGVLQWTTNCFYTTVRGGLCTEKPHYHRFLLSANTAAGQLPSAWSALLRNSILPPPGYQSLCPPGTRDVLRTIIAFSSKALPKPFILLHGSAQRLIPPSTSL